MADKNREPKRGKQRRRSKGEVPAAFPDPRTMEGVLFTLGGGKERPLHNAQQVMYQAFEERNPSKQLELAKMALEISADCADAYVLLAEHARSRKEALELYSKGVEAGERAIGKENFPAATGHFWGILKTRPYMRARWGLADCLWSLGRREEAVQHVEDMLRLNPNDNQGLRYSLIGWLLNMDRDDDLERLLDAYPDEASAHWAYAKILVTFRKNGDTPAARKLLKAAKKTNKFVPAYLLGQKPLPAHSPTYYGIGDEKEAILCAASLMGGWKSIPGATAWLREVEGGTKKNKSPKTEGPRPLVKERLKQLPFEPDVWQADCRQLSNWIRMAGRKVRPWMLLVASRSNGLVLAHDLLDDSPSTDHLWDKLAEAMQRPAAGDPHRPSELQVRPNASWMELRPSLEELDISLVTAGDLDMLNFLFDDLGKHVAGEPQPGLLDVLGVHPAQVGKFFEAAADYYRQAPWRLLGFEDTIKVECDKFKSGPCYAVVMGQSGLTFGLALYDELRVLQKLRRGQMTERENARLTVALTVTFGDETDLGVKDLDAIAQHGWKVAGPEAYPSIFRKERGLTMRPPLAWELELMEGCLRAVPQFMQKYGPEATAKDTLVVPVASGECRITLSWVSE